LKEKLRNNKIIFVLLWLEGAVISFNTACVAAVIPAIARDLHKDSFEIARIISFYMIPYGVGALLYAPLTRFFTYRKCLMLAMAVYAAASFVSGCSRSLNAMLLAQAVAGVAAADGAVAAGGTSVGGRGAGTASLLGVFFLTGGVTLNAGEDSMPWAAAGPAEMPAKAMARINIAASEAQSLGACISPPSAFVGSSGRTHA